jgi:hypothetical protein
VRAALAERLPTTIAGQSHTIEHRIVGGEVVVGVATTFLQAREIHDELRRRGYLGPVVGQWRAVRNANAARVQARADERRARRFEITAERNVVLYFGNDRPSATHPRRAHARGRTLLSRRSAWRARVLRAREGVARALRGERAAVNVFVHAANGTVVAEILGAAAPIRERAGDVTVATPGALRYHEGTPGDPIPIVWYKPVASYQNVTVFDSTTNANVVLTPFGGANAAVSDPRGTVYRFGVHPNNVPGAGTTWVNNPRHGRARTTQVALNGVLRSMGVNLAGLDGDHVRDLGFGGQDVIDNYWPLDSATNRLAYTGWRSQYYLHYKKTFDATTGLWTLARAPLNSGTMVGKSVRTVKPAAAQAVPEPNSVTRGSWTNYGAAAQIAVTGGFINEA